MQRIIMQTELKDKYAFSEGPPLPPAPHFDSASIAAAKRVQPLRWRRISRYSRDVLRPRTELFAGLLMMVLGIATMAGLNKQKNVAPATPVTAEMAEANVDGAPDVGTDSTAMASPNGSLSVVTDRRRHPGRRHARLLGMFDPGAEAVTFEDQPSVYGRNRARLVKVAQ